MDKHAKEVKKYLNLKGLNNGDHVSFEVENQYSGVWLLPTEGILRCLEKDEGEPYIEVTYKNQKEHVSINRGYDAYLGTIQKITQPYIFSEKFLEQFGYKENKKSKTIKELKLEVEVLQKEVIHEIERIHDSMEEFEEMLDVFHQHFLEKLETIRECIEEVQKELGGKDE